MAEKALRLREAEDEVVLQAYFDVIDQIRHDVDRKNLTQDRSRELKLSTGFLTSYVHRYAEAHGTIRKISLIAAHRQLGMALLLLHDLPGSESAIRESLRLSETMMGYAANSELRILHGVNLCSLGWILGMSGRWSEAEQAAQSSVDAWEELVRVFPDQPDGYTELAVCRRNLAIIREAAGGNGLADAIASVDAAVEGLDRSHADENMLCLSYETLIDSEQLLGMLFWQRSRWVEAERVRRSSISHLQGVLELVESLFEKHTQVPKSAHFREALSLARQNRAPLGKHLSSDPQDAGVVEAGDINTDEWHWKRLANVPGQILPMDLVTRGYRLPGEFEPQDALLMSWQQEWSQEATSSIVSAVHPTLSVVLLVDSLAQQQAAKRHLRRAGVSLDRIQFLQAKIDTVWIRDYGPLSVESASRVPIWVDPIYNGPAGLDRYEDDELPQVLARTCRVPTASLHRLVEGGAVLSNGAGICLVSTKLKDLNAQLGIGERQLTDSFRQYLGAEQVVYLEPLVDEPTGHVDWFCAFTAADTIVVGEYGTEDPVNRDRLNRHAARLAQLETPSGKLRVVRIPMPPRGQDYFGGSYTNVIFANGVLIVPTWPEASTEMERQVLEQYRQLLPGWKVVPLPSRRFGVRGGGPHCFSINLRFPQPVSGSDPAT